MINFFKRNWQIILIFLLALGLRVYRLNQFPVGFLWDEAALGYNAYSILKTARDEYGSFLPLIFKSFGDYKPGFYVYLTVPFVWLFGLNETAVRLPSALAGALAVLVSYWFLKENSDNDEKNKSNSSLSALTFAFLLAISPWQINFSRGAWELNLMLLEFLLGFFFLLRFWRQNQKIFLYFSCFFLLLSLLTYQSAKFLVPVLILGFYLFFRKEACRIKKRDNRSFLIIVFVGYFIFNLATLAGGKGGRIKAMSIFSYPRSNEEAVMFLQQDNGNSLIYKIFHGQPIFFLRSILGRYFNHFSGKFLFIEGDWSNARNGTIYQGVLYYPDILLLVLGLVVLIGKKRTALENLMVYWLFLAPVPAALTRDSVSSVRSYTMVIPLAFILSVGFSNLIFFLKKINKIFAITIFIAFIYLYFFFFIRFLDLYFIHDPRSTSADRLYGYKQAVEYLLSAINQKDKVIFTPKYGQPYIFYLFYSQYDPGKYQIQARLKENPYGDVGEVEKIDKIEFRKINFAQDRGIPNALLIGDEFELPANDILQEDTHFAFTREIKFLNGWTAFRIVETK